MKKVVLLALAGALAISTFAAEKGKRKHKKNSKAVKTEQVCPASCSKTGCHMA